MTADELDAMMAQFTNEQLLAAYANRFRSVVVCTVGYDALAEPQARVMAPSILEARVLGATLMHHIHCVSQGLVKPNPPPEGLRT